MKNFFFYGSLRTGYWNNLRVLSKDAVRVGDATTVKPFKLYLGLKGTVPTVVPGGKTLLHGELYQLNEKDSQKVFWLESGYESDEFEVVLDDGTIVNAMIFHHDSPEDCGYLSKDHVVVASGDYTKAVKTDGSRIS